jgi:hypothetical protein
VDTNQVRVGPIIYAAIALRRINDGWHSFQVGLSDPSRYGQLRIVAGKGHRIHQEKRIWIGRSLRDDLIHDDR